MCYNFIQAHLSAVFVVKMARGTKNHEKFKKKNN